MVDGDLKEISDSLALKEKLDAAISLAGQYNSNAASGPVKIHPIDRIRIGDGIEMAADVLGVELRQSRSPSGSILHYFCYDGWESSQASTEIAAGGRLGHGIQDL